MKQFNTVVEVIKYVNENYCNQEAFNYQTDAGWDTISTQTFCSQIKYIALGLHNLGVKKKDMVGIFAHSSTRWTIADLAIASIGAVSVPLFSNLSVENFEFEVKQTQMKHIFVAGEEEWKLLRKQSNTFQNVISLYDEGEDRAAFRFQELLEQGRSLDEREPDLYEKITKAIAPDDLASIVYTSGSTGTPKGVMLTHFNIAGMLCIDPYSWDKDKDSYLSLLPIAHIFARTINLLMITWGVKIYYIRDISTVAAVCQEIHPTVIIVVPRILEKIYTKMLLKVQQATGLKRKIGLWAFKVANMDNSSLYKKIMAPIADKLVYSTLREALGGKLRIVISGGAALNPHLHHFYLSIGVPLYEGWGLTEAATVSCSPVGHIKIGTVGKPFEMMRAKISADDEILVQGPIVTKGYYKNEEANKALFSEDGWLRTGDKGSMDNEGYISIRGRLKELYKTSTGEYIAPVPIEQMLIKEPFIDMAMIVADSRKFASCLIFPDHDELYRMKRANHLESLSDEDFVQRKVFTKKVDEVIDQINKHLNHWEEIHAYRVILTPPSIEGGELTPTMKIRRNEIEKKYKSLIDSIYSEEKL